MSSTAGMPGAIAVRSCGVKRAAVYQRQRPERTAGYHVVRQNLETWLAQRRVGYPVPHSENPAMKILRSRLLLLLLALLACFVTARAQGEKLMQVPSSRHADSRN